MKSLAKKIWLDGKLLFWQKANVHVLTHALHYGSAVFEGIRFYNTDKGPAIFRLDDHITRLFYSASVLDMKIPYTKAQIKKAIINTVKSNNLKEGYIRPLVFYGAKSLGLYPKNLPVQVTIIAMPFPKLFAKTTINVKTSSFIRLHPHSTIASAKISGHYVNSILASLEAKKAGYDEALMFDFKGNIAEGSGENFFLVKNNVIKTASLEDILPGITRQSLIKVAVDLGYETDELELTEHDINMADEAFFSGTAAEITPIAKIDNIIINNGKVGDITLQLQEKFYDIVHGLDEKYKEWLTYVK